MYYNRGKLRAARAHVNRPRLGSQSITSLKVEIKEFCIAFKVSWRLTAQDGGCISRKSWLKPKRKPGTDEIGCASRFFFNNLEGPVAKNTKSTSTTEKKDETIH